MTVDKQRQWIVEKSLQTTSMLKPVPQITDQVTFGKIKTDHMLVCDYIPDQGGWLNPKIMPYQSMMIDASSLVLHYGQEVFEGLKAFKSQDNNQIYVFRPEENGRRLARSAERLAMEPFPEELFLQCVKELVKVESRWVLPHPWALYLRPTIIATEEGVSYRSSTTYRFFIIVAPVKSYYSTESKVRIKVERNYCRAAYHGVGEAKCGGNYAAALLAKKEANLVGASDVMWLDPLKRRYVEEVGTMNLMFAYGEKLKTPRLSGSILPGITRKSLITLAREMNLEVEETDLDIDQILSDIESGKITEAFGCGTAVVVCPISEIVDGGQTYKLPSLGKKALSNRLQQALEAIQSGTTQNHADWSLAILD